MGLELYSNTRRVRLAAVKAQGTAPSNKRKQMRGILLPLGKSTLSSTIVVNGSLKKSLIKRG